MTAVEAGPLAGYRIGVTAERRRDEIASLLIRRGAAVTVGSAIRLIALVDDAVLRQSTVACIEEPCDDVVVTTGIGFRGWMEAADAWGLGEQLRDRLARSRILSRGPKATGAIRSAGLNEEWTAATETTDEVVERLLIDGVAGRRIAIQMHGLPVARFSSMLTAQGGDVVEVPVYRWDYPTELTSLDRLIGDVAAGRLDAVTFTSALAVAALLARSEDLNVAEQVLDAMRAKRPWACCVGPVTAAQLVEAGVPVISPPRARLGDLLRTVSVEIPRRLDVVVDAGTTRLLLRRDGFVADGVFVPVRETPMAILHELAAQPGELVTRQRLIALLPDATNDNALETSVARLRARLPSKDLVETVVKRGYRLAASAVDVDRDALPE